MSKKYLNVLIFVCPIKLSNYLLGDKFLQFFLKYFNFFIKTSLRHN